MIKARNRKLSMLLVLAMLMTMFIGVGTASAAAEFKELRTPVVQTSTAPQPLGSVVVKLSDVRALPGDGAWLTISLPKGCTFDYTYDEEEIETTDNLSIDQIKKTAKDTLEILVKPKYVPGDDADGDITIFFEGIIVKSGSGDIVARFLSNDSAFGTLNTAVIGKIIKSGATTVLPKSVVTFGDSGADMDTLVIAESTPGSFKVGEVITVKLPKGFTWGLGTAAEGLEVDLPDMEDLGDLAGQSVLIPGSDDYHIAGAWGMATIGFGFDPDGIGTRTLEVSLNSMGNNVYDLSDALGISPYDLGLVSFYFPTTPREVDGKPITPGSGRINISSGTGGFFKIVPDDNAKFGDVYVTVSSKLDSVKKQDALVAVYGDYGVKVVEDTKEDVDSGRANQELGEFLIEEALPESLDAGRSLYFELPKGVKWAKHDDGEPIIELESEDGDSFTPPEFTLSNSDRKVKVSFDFDNGRFSSEAAQIRVKGMEVNVEPSFTGDIAVKVYGKAGVEGEAVVGVAARPVDLKVVNPTKVEIGAMNQAAGDILLIETKDEGILDEYLDGNIFDDEYETVAPQIVVTLPKGVEFYKDPTVEVEEGDLEIDDVEYNDDSLVITMDSASSKKSTIRISDVFLTVDRTVPEGDVVATFQSHKVKEVKDEDNVKRDVIKEAKEAGSTALVDWATEESYGKVVIATTITPSQGGHAKFVIASNIYEIGGVPYVMDAVPYIKDSRSYVPMRYLAQMLGAEIAWSEAEQTVTLTKEGETEVVFTIGSTSYTVNGEAMTADVAPEIVNDRSFLPARFAAEAFGAQVGWDEATQTVIIVR